MIKFGIGCEENFRTFAEALQFGCGLTGEGSELTQRRQVTDDISHLLTGAYAFSINPLPVLRKALPNFEWKFHDLLKKKNTDAAIRQRIEASDLFWFPEIIAFSFDQIVTARLIEPTESPLMIIGQPFQILIEAGAQSTVEKLRVWGVREDREEHYPD